MPVSLHTHSWYSLLEGASSLEALFARAKACGYTALALTDTNNLYGAVSFVEQAHRFGIRPLLGACLRQHRSRCVALIGERVGYRSLCRIISRLHLGTTLLADLLADNAEGLHVLVDDGVLAERLRDAFGPRLWLEVVRPPRSERQEQELLVQGRRLGLRPVASTAAHFATPDDYHAFRLATAVRQLTLLDRLPRRLPITPEHHLVDAATLRQRFRDLPEAVAHTDLLAEQLRSDVLPRDVLIPRPRLPRGLEPTPYLRLLCERGLRRRDLGNSLGARQRLREELTIIEAAGLASYFLVVRDIARHARKRGHSMALRGSAGNSLICYLLEITDVDPLRFGLELERFLHPGRTDLPDIDLDFDWKVRDQVIEYVFRRHGPAHVARISSHLFLQPRSAFRESAKVHGLSNEQVSRLLEVGSGQWAVDGEDVALPSGFPLEAERWPRIVADARLLLGRPHHLSIHPGGVVITPRAVEDFVPLQRAPKGVVITQLDKDAVELIGLVKIDLLGNRALATVGEAIGIVGSGQWVVGSGQWAVGSGRWAVGSGQCAVGGDGARRDSYSGEGSLRARSAGDGARGSAEDPAATPLPTAHCPLPTAHSPLPTAHYPLPTAHCPLPTAHSPLPTAHYPLPTAHYPLPTTHYPLSTIHYPLPTLLLQQGETLGVNQLESPAMRHLLIQMRPTGLEDVIQALAMIRPGAASIGMKECFIRRRRGLEPVRYLHPNLESALAETQGLMLYEDDALRVIRALTGLNAPEADRFRKRVSKHRTDQEARALAEEFLAACARCGVPEHVAGEVWVQLAKFNQYSFCKSHAVSYGLIAWKAVHLKVYQPLAFWTAALNNNQGMYPRRVYVEAIKRAGIRLRLPCVNRSAGPFAVEGDAIRTGLDAIATLDEAFRRTLLEDRQRHGPYADLANFRRRLQPGPETLAALIRCGALDGIGRTRPALFLEAELQDKERRETATEFLFPCSLFLVPWEPADYEAGRRLRDEWELLGFVIGPPLMSFFRPRLPAGLVTSHELPDRVGRVVRVAGVVATSRLTPIEDGRTMQFVTLEDEWGLIEVTLFPGTCPPVAHLALGPYLATGLVEEQYGVIGVTGRRFELWTAEGAQPNT